jgi:LmbE family N-acetylglucosaminyl deacetylase
MRSWLHRQNIHPRRWLDSLLAYHRYMGIIRPQLLEGGAEDYVLRRKLLTKAWEPAVIRAPIGKRLLAISPHPDDESIGAGALLLAHRDIAEIHLICLFNGRGGGRLDGENWTQADLIQTRAVEFTRAGTMLKARSTLQLGLEAQQFQRGVEQLRALVAEIDPDVVLLPWFLDGHDEHQLANRIYAEACSDLDVDVFAYEIWTLLEPNAVFDITEQLDRKLELIGLYESQTRTVDYVAYARALAQLRAFQTGVNARRSGCFEAFIALPNRDYCKLVNLGHPAVRDSEKDGLALQS